MEKASAYQKPLSAELDAISELSPDPVMILGFNGIVRYANPALRAVSGYGDSELLGSDFRHFIVNQDLPKVEASFARLAKGEEPHLVKLRSLTKMGGIRLIQWHAAHFNKDSLLALGRDITDWPQVVKGNNSEGEGVGEQSSSTGCSPWAGHDPEREHQFETLAKAAPVGIFRLGLDGSCTSFNERYLEIIGFSRAETLGAGCFDRVVEEDRRELQSQWQRLSDKNFRFERQYRVRRKDGVVIWVLGQATPEVGESGSVIGYIGSITDITQSKLNELELRNYREHLEDMVRERTLELEAVNRELESFSYSVSHDLRAPLRAINGFNSALTDEYGDKLDQQARFYLQRVQANSRHMGDLIDDLLELSKVTQAELRREWVDLSTLAKNLLIEMRLADPEREMEANVMEGLKVFADPTLMRVLMQNLLGNAWKYSGKQPRSVIEVGALASASDQSTFFVRDNGVGFDMSCAQDLFRAFQRLHDSSQFEGTGIGLATVHRIVSRHGGRVWAEGEEGSGATFYFVLH